MLAAAEKTAVLTPWNTSDPVAGAIYSALCERHGKKVQEKLDAGFVTICGLGGLGSNIAVSLARIGVGHLRLVDFDNVTGQTSTASPILWSTWASKKRTPSKDSS